MEQFIKHFSELTTGELYGILKLRTDVFVVEQNCPYPELDGLDQTAVHLWFSDENGIEAYLRIFQKQDGVYIGRVVSRKRRCGLASLLLKEALRIAEEEFSAERILLEAQTYARSLYEKIGFVQSSEEFLEDGIPHIRMELKL